LVDDFPNWPDFRDKLATVSMNLGYLLRPTSRPKEAEEAFRKSLAIRKQLAKDSPTSRDVQLAVARGYKAIGDILGDMGRHKEAREAFTDALSILKPLAAEFPKRLDYRAHLAGSYNNLGWSLISTTNRLKEAETDLVEAVALEKQLVKDNPYDADSHRMLNNSYSGLGTLFQKLGRLNDEEAAYADALAFYKQLAADSPDLPEARNYLAGTLVDLARLWNHRRNFQTAKGYLEEAQPYHAAALKANPKGHAKSFQDYLKTLVQANAGLLDQTAALQTAQKLCDLGCDPPGDAYNAACALALCIPILAKHEPAAPASTPAAVQFYGDEAMKMLRDAVNNGWKDAAHIKKDTDLDSLQQREDFKKLLSDLEQNAENQKPEITNQKAQEKIDKKIMK
jgi:tetratricopeptide (TPR) repeat protein